MTPDPHTYTSQEAGHMRDTAFLMAQLLFEKHMPNADKDDFAYKLALLQYAESLAQTYILAGVTPDAFSEEYYKIKD